jgi:hypothetical protein
MKQTKTKLLCLILTALMLLSGLTACGKDKEGKDSNLIKLGDYELLYKGACIMEDSDGNDAIVLTLDFTNNSKENASYLWSVDETVMQNGVELEAASIITDYENLETVVSDQFTDVAPGATLEVRTAFVLKDTTSEVKATFEEFLGSKKGTITVDPATLSRETVSHTEPETTNTTGDTLLDWWNGEWYGWWKMSGCYGDYESMEGDWWDVCGVIDLDTDYTGTIELWDEDYTRSDPMASAQVSLSEAGTGEHGTVMSEGGWFTNVTLEHADWIVDPGLLDYDDMIWISGDYEDGDDEFHYDIYLRPWGLYWKDMEEDAYPYRYTDWYLPLIDAGKSMPDAIGEGAPTNQTNAAAPGGNGIVTEEQVQKGYVWMNEINKNIFDATYEDIVAYFGVEGEFVKEEYSDHMQSNYRYYKWISSEDSSHFIYVNFCEKTPGVYTVSAYNTSGFSGTEAIEKYLDIVKAEAAEANKAASANAEMKDFSVEIAQFAKDDVKVKIMTKIHQSAIMSAPTTSQYAAITALKECDGEIDRMRDEYNMRRRLVVKSFNDMGLTCFEPRGAFYAFPCIKSTGMSSQDFCTKLLEEKHVAIIPGDAFGASGEGYARVSYAYSVEHLKEALKRIKEFLQENGIYHGI